MLALEFLAAGSLAAGAQNPPEDGTGFQADRDKGGYTLCNPTPRKFMREMYTDRPDQTESPYTVDAGHLQVELDFINAVLDRSRSGGNDLRSVTWSVMPVNLKVGLLNNVDVEFVLDTYTHSRLEDSVVSSEVDASGFGDVQTRLKLNFWGNDGGRTAFGMLPFVKWGLPASGLRNGKTEGGVIFPFALNIAESWDLGAMTEFDFLANQAGGYDTQFVNTITVGHALTQKLGMYLEFAAIAGSAPGFRWRGQADMGWTYALGNNIQLDCGANFGITASAPNAILFTGISWRY